MSRCIRCGKDLTDPVSLSLDMGPVCRIASKYEEYWNKSMDLFGSASYDYRIMGDSLVLLDLSAGGASIASEIDMVLYGISAQEGCLDQYNVIYVDSNKVYDGICTDNSKFVGFYSINTTDLDEAVIRARHLRKEGKAVPCRELSD